MSSNLISQARTAIEAGDLAQARRLLQHAVHQDPQNHMAWLLLARITPSPQAAWEYIQRAEMLQPHSMAVRRERERIGKEFHAQKQPPGSAIQKVTPQVKPTIGYYRLTLGGLIVILFLALVWLGSNTLENLPIQIAEASGATAVDPQRSSIAAYTPLSPGPINEFLARNIAVLAGETATPTATATPIPTNTVPPTPTLAPTNTATPIPPPTATVQPTFISPQTGNIGRPAYVGANERWIDVSIAHQTLTAYEGDQPMFSSVISSGTWQFPTVEGQFRTYMKYESQTMNGYLLGYDYYLPDVPYVMYFFNDYAIHGTYWHNNFGTPMSHGCVNMNSNDAGWLFNWAPVGTVVNVHS